MHMFCCYDRLLCWGTPCAVNYGCMWQTLKVNNLLSDCRSGDQIVSHGISDVVLISLGEYLRMFYISPLRCFNILPNLVHSVKKRITLVFFILFLFFASFF